MQQALNSMYSGTVIQQKPSLTNNNGQSQLKNVNQGPQTNYYNAETGNHGQKIKSFEAIDEQVGCDDFLDIIGSKID